MSSSDMASRRSKRTPTTPNRYSKDFVLDTTVVKNEVTPKTSLGKIESINTESGRSRVPRRAAKRSSNDEEESVPINVHHTKVKKMVVKMTSNTLKAGKKKVEKMQAKKNEKKKAAKKQIGSCSPAVLGAAGEGAPSPRRPAVDWLKIGGISAKVAQTPEKDTASRGPVQISVPTSDTKILTSNEPVKITPASAVYKALQQALETHVALHAGNKQSPMKVSLVEQGSGKTYSVRLVSSTPLTKMPQVQPETSPANGTADKNKNQNVMVKVDLIKPIHTRYGSALSRTGQQDPTGMGKAMPSSIRTPKDAFQSPGNASSTKVSTVSIKGRTTFTQTKPDDLRLCAMVNHIEDTKCLNKVITVSKDKIAKSCFKPPEDSHSTVKNCQTTSRSSDINFTILEALAGSEKSKTDKDSLRYKGECSPQVDKEIQSMLFGQSLDTAASNFKNGIPSKVINGADAEAEPAKANITVESWSLALTVVTPEDHM